jgi:hypothetical protein
MNFAMAYIHPVPWIGDSVLACVRHRADRR